MANRWVSTMMKHFLFIFLSIPFLCFGQDKVTTKNGSVLFEASVSSFEEVKAKLKNGACVLNTNTGDIAAILFIKSFTFKNGLMQEHFNENYMESDTYPKAIFIGKIANFSSLNIDNKTTKVNIAGTLEIHGIKKQITVPAEIQKSSNLYHLVSNFKLKPEDFNIKIPSIVGYKIAKVVDVNLNFKLN